ncbi:hypothetical protein L915_05776 [Phytophthora nicotianae]|uniref:Reverse transcriptase domain-containing protein n=1 Tax=Phytophthora nicotianae TaxID=4792 RepID=W2H5J4_PHYNI|nr:hypothetical protein L915_05776 [Phytophthora nicotianae]
MLNLKLADQRTTTLQKRTIPLTLRMDGLDEYSAEFYVIEVPDNRDILLGLPWLHTVNPLIDWKKGVIRPSLARLRVRLRDLLSAYQKSWCHQGNASSERETSNQTDAYFSVDTGETKCISSKQFRRLLKKDKDVEYVFIIQPRQPEIITKATSIDDYKDHAIYPYLQKNEGLFRQKLPEELPPREHGEHTMEVHSENPISRQQWRQSPAQEAEIRRWVQEMLRSGMIRPSTSPHGAPTFCVRKPDGWRIVHGYRAMNLNTVRRTPPMPRKDVILEKMQGCHYFSCLNLLSGYYQFSIFQQRNKYNTAKSNVDGPHSPESFSAKLPKCYHPIELHSIATSPNSPTHKPCSNNSLLGEHRYYRTERKYSLKLISKSTVGIRFFSHRSNMIL